MNKTTSPIEDSQQAGCLPRSGSAVSEWPGEKLRADILKNLELGGVLTPLIQEAVERSSATKLHALLPQLLGRKQTPIPIQIFQTGLA